MATRNPLPLLLACLAAIFPVRADASHSQIWVLDAASDPTVWVLDSAGSLTTLPDSGFSAPRALAFGPDGGLYVLDDAEGDADDVWHYDFATRTWQSLAGSSFVDPRGLAFGPDGSLWILDGEAGEFDDVWRYDFDSQAYETLPGSNFVDARGIAFGPGGSLWILEQEEGELDDVWRYDFSGTFYETLPGSAFIDPRALRFAADGTLWVMDAEAGELDDVWRYDFPSQTYETLAGSNLVDPRGLVFDPGGDLWMLDAAAGDDVLVYDFGADRYDVIEGTDFGDPRAIAAGAAPVHVPALPGVALGLLGLGLLLRMRAGALLVFLLLGALPAHAESGDAFSHSRLSISLGFDATTQLSRSGDAVRYRHAVVEPWVEVGLRVLERPEARWLQSVDLALGWWRRDHDEWTDTPYLSRRWYEADYYAQVALGLLEHLELRAGLSTPNTPELAYDDVREVEVSASFDDAPFWQARGLDFGVFRGLQPFASVMREEYRTPEDASTTRKHVGWYYEVGLEPTLQPLDARWLRPLRISFPVRYGLGNDGYTEFQGPSRDYELREVGVALRYPLLARFHVYLGAASSRFRYEGGHASEISGMFGLSVTL